MIPAALAAVMPIDTSGLVNFLGLLLDSALKGSLLVAAAAIAAYLLRGRSAAARHAAWTAAVVGHLALPAITLLAPAWRLPFLPAPPWLTPSAQSVSTPSRMESPSSAATVTTLQPSGAVAQPTSPSPTSDVQSSGPSQTVTPAASTGAINIGRLSLLAVLWITGSILVLLRLALGTVRVGKLAREGSRVIDGAWLSLAQRVAGRLGINRPLTLLHGDRLGIPVTWGIVYPAVLLPPDAEEWPEERRRFVLVHEMAHIKRFDALTQLAAQIAVAIFWFDPLIWLAAHRMRVEREHACDDYVLRDGTKPSLYAGELLDMVRSLGTPAHEKAAPAFAALAMARRSEFEGRMLAILDPKLDRHTLDRRSTFLTAAVVALLVLPLAALRPFEQPAVPGASSGALTSEPGAGAKAKPGAGTSAPPGRTASYTCDSADLSARSKTTTTHISVADEPEDGVHSLSFMMSAPGRCTEASMMGLAKFSADETRLVSLPPGGFVRVREKLPGVDRSFVAVPGPAGDPSYVVRLNGRAVDFDAAMSGWLAALIPEVRRESALDVPNRIRRVRQAGGVSGVLRMIASIRSSSAKTAHYRALLDTDDFTQSEIDAIARSAGQQLASSPSDLRAVLQVLMPARSTARVARPASVAPAAPALESAEVRKPYPSAAAAASIGESIKSALKDVKSSGDKASLLAQFAVGGDPEAVLMALRGVKDVTSSGDKATLLTTLAAPSLSRNRADLRRAFFEGVLTIPSEGDIRRVLIAAAPYGHTSSAVTIGIIEGIQHIRSPGDKAQVLIAVAQQRLLTSPAVRSAFLKAAKEISSPGDQVRVLQAAAQQ
jgi:beta-lactamase regulating signal transducer with metallopeptidase domain